MRIAKTLPSVAPLFKGNHHRPLLLSQFSGNSMSSQEFQQGVFSFTNRFDRSEQQLQQQRHQQLQIAAVQQIRRDKSRLQGFEPPSPLVPTGEDESGGYETAAMLSEMFSFQPAGATTATGLLENQIVQASYRNSSRHLIPTATGNGNEWYGGRQGITVDDLCPSDDHSNKDHNFVHGCDSLAAAAAAAHHQHQISSINGDSAAAMQLFLMNPQPKSPSPSPSHPPASSSTLHMLLPNPSSSTLQGFSNTAPPAATGGGGHFGPSQFTWVPERTHEIGGVVEGQGLSLSLSSSLQHIEAAKAEELRIEDGGMMFFNHGEGSASSVSVQQYPYTNFLQGGLVQNQQIPVGFGSSSSSIFMANLLRNSKYSKAAQELLEEFCSVGRGQLKKGKLGKKNNTNPNSNPSGSGGGGGGSSPSSKDGLPPLSSSDKLEQQRRKVKLLSMLDEVDRRYNHYCEQMQMVVNSFDLVMGFGAAIPYTALAQKAMSRHFRCLKDAIAVQLKHSCELLGEKDASTTGVTKGETPRLKLLEQSLRQQRAFHQMGMMEQEAWRPQRGLPERSVNILRAWLFEHFLHPYPSDADKHLLSRQTGLSRNQVSNWFINARVRLWKPMIEEMYEQETKDEADDDQTSGGPAADNEREKSQNSVSAQTPMRPTATTVTTTTTTVSPTAKRSQINAIENNPSLIAFNTHCFSENQAIPHHHAFSATNALMPTSTVMVGSTPQPFANTCHRGGIVAGDFGTATTTTTNPNSTPDMGSKLIRFGTVTGDVSLTLGLRHTGNLPENNPFSVRDFGSC